MRKGEMLKQSLLYLLSMLDLSPCIAKCVKPSISNFQDCIGHDQKYFKTCRDVPVLLHIFNGGLRVAWLIDEL